MSQQDLIRLLGLPTPLARLLTDDSPLTPAPGRIMRFDFHYTAEGWRISEANSDVPGGFSEASFTSLIASHYPALEMPGNPANQWANVLRRSVPENAVVLFLSAPGFMEDHQVVSFLAKQLRVQGCRCYLAKPEQLEWSQGKAFFQGKCYNGAVDLIVRFYQAEWLSRLPPSRNWELLFRNGQTLVCE